MRAAQTPGPRRGNRTYYTLVLVAAVAEQHPPTTPHGCPCGRGDCVISQRATRYLRQAGLTVDTP
jgi:hypothetical protein